MYKLLIHLSGPPPLLSLLRHQHPRLRHRRSNSHPSLLKHRLNSSHFHPHNSTNHRKRQKSLINISLLHRRRRPLTLLPIIALLIRPTKHHICRSHPAHLECDLSLDITNLPQRTRLQQWRSPDRRLRQRPRNARNVH